MDVFIGNYVNRWTSNVHDNYMTKKYGYDWPAKKYYTRYERFLKTTEDVLQSIYNNTINHFLDRKKRFIKVKIHEYDHWSADHTLALVILPVLKQLKECKNSSAPVDNEDVPKELRTSKKQKEAFNKDGTIDENYFKRWDYVLDKMIWSFEQVIDDDWDDKFYSGDIKFETIPLNAAGQEVSEDEATQYELVRSKDDTSKFDAEGYKKYNEQIDEGLRLFGKYYRNLWS